MTCAFIVNLIYEQWKNKKQDKMRIYNRRTKEVLSKIRKWQGWHVILAVAIFIITVAAAWGLFGLPDIWKNVFVVIVSAAATYLIVALVNSMGQKQQQKLQKEQS